MSLARVENFSFSRDGFGMANTQAMSITVPRYLSVDDVECVDSGHDALLECG